MTNPNPSNDKKKESNPQLIRCQKCLEHGHWTFQCKGKRKILHRSTRSLLLQKRVKEFEAKCQLESMFIARRVQNSRRGSKVMFVFVKDSRMEELCDEEFGVCGLCNPIAIANALTIDNANACNCEAFPCVHDRYQKEFARKKPGKEMRKKIEEETECLTNLSIAAEIAFDVTDSEGACNGEMFNYLDDNDNKVFYLSLRNWDVSSTCDSPKSSKKVQASIDGICNNHEIKHHRTHLHKKKRFENISNIIETRKYANKTAENSIWDFHHRNIREISSENVSKLTQVKNSVENVDLNVDHCEHINRNIQKQSIGLYSRNVAKKRKEHSSESSNDDSDQSSSMDSSGSSTSDLSSDSSDSSSSSTSSSTSLSSSSTDSDTSDDESYNKEARTSKRIPNQQ